MTREEKIIAGASIAGLVAYFMTRPKSSNASVEGSSAGPGWDPYKGTRPQQDSSKAGGWDPYKGTRPKQDSSTQEPDADEAQRVAEDPIVCLRWKTGNAKVAWGPPQYAKIEAAIESAMKRHYQDFGSIAAARDVTFSVTRAAIKDVCPTVPVPALLEQVDEYKANPDLGFWWDQLWDYFWAAAWGSVMEAGGGSL